MTTLKVERALFQVEKDLMQLNDEDRAIISDAERRIEGRIKLLKMLRQTFKRRGLVKDPIYGYWVRKDLL